MNLTALLALAAVVDLAVNRLVLSLFLSGPAHASKAGVALATVGLFSAQLTGILAIVLFATAYIGVVRRRELFPRGMGVAVAFFVASFTLLVVYASGLPQVPDRLQIYLTTTFAFLAWVLAFSASRPPTPWRAKFGVTLFAFPAILHAAALFADRSRWEGRGVSPATLLQAGSLVALCAAAIAPWSLGVPLAGRPRAGAWAAGAVAAVLVLAGLRANPALVAAVVMQGLRIDPTAWQPGGGFGIAVAGALAIFGGVTFLVHAFAAGGPPRLAGYGVFLVVIAGYQIVSPRELACAATGLLALALGVARAVDAGRVAPPRPATGP